MTYTSGIALDSSGNLYIAGYAGTSWDSSVPCYWKNGTLICLPLGLGNIGGYTSAVVIGP
jgi:hypothetical protein